MKVIKIIGKFLNLFFKHVCNSYKGSIFCLSEVTSTPHEAYTSSTGETIGQETVIVSSNNEGSHMGPMIRIKSASSSSFIPIQEISKSSTINITTHQQVIINILTRGKLKGLLLQ